MGNGKFRLHLLPLTVGLAFVAVCALFAIGVSDSPTGASIIGIAAGVGAYMALNIGANDAANNVGPAVGSKALSMVGALLVAAIFECAGALIAGGDVVSTISTEIVDPKSFADPREFMLVMLAALLAAAIWINLASIIGAPVSTTHSIVGGVVGATIAAAGLNAVDMLIVSRIAVSWVVSPVLGGIIAAAVLAFIKTMIMYRIDKIAAARRWIPILISIMTGVFAAYLATKGLKNTTSIGIHEALLIGVAASVISWVVAVPLIRYQSQGVENCDRSLHELFKLPLVGSAALLSFAHGANDVANAIGPLAAIVSTARSGVVPISITIPFWVILIGAFGISFGLALFGAKLIRLVGTEITKLNPIRAFCVSLSAAGTVIVASSLGLPVSSTHIVVGSVFGVGLFREWHVANSVRRRLYVNQRSGFLSHPPSKRKRTLGRHRLVRRRHLLTIVSAWLVTVPSAAALSGGVLFLLQKTLL